MIGVIPTDTIYGIVGSALDPATVERIYKLRKRNPAKPMIILISDIRDVARFGVVLDPATKNVLKKAWPGKVTVVLPLGPRLANIKKFAYLHRGTNTLAFRLPKPKWLRGLLAKTGPLVAPSANHEGKKPARTIREAKKYFGNSIDFYVNAGRMDSQPSRIIAVSKGKTIIIRP